MPDKREPYTPCQHERMVTDRYTFVVVCERCRVPEALLREPPQREGKS